MSNELNSNFYAIPKVIRDKAFEIAEEAFPLMHNQEIHYTEGLEELQTQHGGEIWNSGGNCMLLTIMHEPIDNTHYSIIISGEVVCVNEANNADDAASPPDETYTILSLYLY